MGQAVADSKNFRSRMVSVYGGKKLTTAQQAELQKLKTRVATHRSTVANTCNRRQRVRRELRGNRTDSGGNLLFPFTDAD